MKYSDELEIDGRIYRIEASSTGSANSGRSAGSAGSPYLAGSPDLAGSPGPAGPVGAAQAGPCELTVHADDVGSGGVAVRVTGPAGELALIGEIIQRSLSGLAQLAAGGVGPNPAGQRFRLRMAEDRRRYPKAWSAWSTDDDSRLLDGYKSGMDVDQLATELGRKPRAVVSRLVKHGVVAGGGT